MQTSGTNSVDDILLEPSPFGFRRSFAVIRACYIDMIFLESLLTRKSEYGWRTSVVILKEKPNVERVNL